MSFSPNSCFIGKTIFLLKKRESEPALNQNWNELEPERTGTDPTVDPRFVEPKFPVPDPRARHAHLVTRQRAGLVRQDRRRRAHRLARAEVPDEVVVVEHPPHAESQR